MTAPVADADELGPAAGEPDRDGRDGRVGRDGHGDAAPLPSEPVPRHPRRVRALWIAAAVTVLAAAFVASLAALRTPLRPTTGIRQRVDRSRHGAIAYVTASDECIRLVAISERPETSAMCVAPANQSIRSAAGTPPHLRFGPSGVLVTPGDAVEQGAPDPPGDDDPRPSTNRRGARVRIVGARSDGYRVEITGGGAARSDIALPAPPPGGHRPTAFWTPDGRRVLVDDGRLLLVHPDGRRPVLIAPLPTGDIRVPDHHDRVVQVYAVSAIDLAPTSEMPPERPTTSLGGGPANDAGDR